MTVTVAKATIYENIYKNFYDIIVAISGFTNIVFPEFHDTLYDKTGDYPVVIISSPDIGWDQFTFGKNVYEGTIVVDIYQTTPKGADEFSSDVADQIETSKDTLSTVGLREVKLASTATDQIPQGKIKLFLKSLTFEYKFYASKTFAF